MLVSQTAAVLSVVAATAVGLWQALNPCIYRGVRSVPGGPGSSSENFCAGSLVEVNGAGVLVVLAVPVLLTAVAYFALKRGARLIAGITTGSLLGFCGLSLATIGLLYLPSLLLIAVALMTGGRASTQYTPAIDNPSAN